MCDVFVCETLRNLKYVEKSSSICGDLPGIKTVKL